MHIVEYGKENKDVIVLLHGGGLSWWNFRDEAEMLKKQFHIVLPVLNGHADSDSDFVDIEYNAKEIIKFIDENFNGKVLLIGGLSLGAQVLIEILSHKHNICEYAIIESALVKPMRVTHYLIRPVFGISYKLIKQRWFSKLQFQFLKIHKDLFEDYYNDTCKITRKNMISFLEANSDFKLPSSLGMVTAKVLILVGSKEQARMKNSAIELQNILPNSTLRILDGFHHGEFSINHPSLYVKQMYEFLNE